MSAYALSYSKAGMAQLWLLTHMNFSQGHFMRGFQAGTTLFLQERELCLAAGYKGACKSCGWEILYAELASLNCPNESLL